MTEMMKSFNAGDFGDVNLDEGLELEGDDMLNFEGSDFELDDEQIQNACDSCLESNLPEEVCDSICNM